MLLKELYDQTILARNKVDNFIPNNRASRRALGQVNTKKKHPRNIASRKLIK